MADPAHSSPAYGSALIFYARAHATAKLKSTLGLLTSLSLLRSAAIPPISTLDVQLASLLSEDRAALTLLARTDAEATALLAAHLSGYATLRRFYDLRDAATPRPLERKREAANCLVAVLESAADCIRGGLYDPEVEAVVSVDGVLALLGEAMPLLGLEKRIFTREQVFTLLRIVEDFESAPTRIQQNAESLLQASAKAYKSGGSGRSLEKSRSDLSSKSSGGLGGSSYDMLASSVMVQSMTSGGSGSAQSATGQGGAEAKRAWDWRKGLEAIGGETQAQKVVMLVRLALAKEVARGWGGQIIW